ncbi:terminase large subunit domain-containing protein [Vitreimonas flagellata]|uniref:terminase large subunit domain-containing protein n=1 Tax=Vitreimonas flagellata TaxID=2560861 RepID=UPI0010758334|nr:terminase family protein [Vitreimonas flagellata]
MRLKPAPRPAPGLPQPRGRPGERRKVAYGGDRPVEIIAPQAGPQAAYVLCPHFDVCYGGARGGGKTFGSLLDWLEHEGRYGAKARGLFIRRHQVDLEDTIEEAKLLFEPLGAKWKEKGTHFRFPSGAILRFRYLDRDEHAKNYQGHQYTRVYVEELTQFPDPKPVDKLKATLRSKYGVPVGFRATCNPGGPGHSWVKQRYIDKGAWRVVTYEFTNPFTKEKVSRSQVFIPARLDDNPKLLQSDPGYVAGLYMSGSEQLVRAWLLGDWNIIEGAFFSRWKTERNVARPFKIPEHWLRFRSFDWGYATPFSCGWWAVASEDTAFESVSGRRLVIPRGGLVRYREWYGVKEGEANRGIERTAEQVCSGFRDEDGSWVPGIVARSEGEQIAYSVADPSIFRRVTGPSIAKTMHGKGVSFRRADNTRVARRGAMGGWDQMRNRIDGVDDEHPMLIVFETCIDFIRTVPALQHDPNNAEDLDTDGEDHAGDDCRYACMSRPWVKEIPVEQLAGQLAVGETSSLTLDDILAELDGRDDDDDRI